MIQFGLANAGRRTFSFLAVSVGSLESKLFMALTVSTWTLLRCSPLPTTIPHHPLPSLTITHHPSLSLTIRHIPHHSSPFLTIPQYLLPFLTIPHHPSPSLTIPHHPSTGKISFRAVCYISAQTKSFRQDDLKLLLQEPNTNRDTMKKISSHSDYQGGCN